MTPKEKAKSLIIKYMCFCPEDWTELEIQRDIYEAKKNSLICVNEVLDGMKNQINQIDDIDTIYWLKVKGELKNFNIL